jgi:hypothetical protein
MERITMIKPWECPKDCPDRKVGCQNPNTCETYRLRVERSQAISSSVQTIQQKSAFAGKRKYKKGE